MNAPNPKPSVAQTLLAFSLAGQLGLMIALPIVVLALAGRWADVRFGTSPLGILGGALCAAVISGVWVYRSVDRLRAQYESGTKT